MLKLPIYLNCHFFQNESDAANIYVYKIDTSGVAAHPFQFKLANNSSGSWENLSVYASPDDAIMILLKELFTTELAEEVNHGQASVNPAEIMEKINRGERSIALMALPKMRCSDWTSMLISKHLLKENKNDEKTKTEQMKIRQHMDSVSVRQA